MCEDVINDAGYGLQFEPPELIGHNRGCMTSVARLSRETMPDRPTAPFKRADLCSILEVNFPGPLRGGAPSSTESSAAIACRSGSDR